MYYDWTKHKKFKPLPVGTAVKLQTINNRVFYGAVVAKCAFEGGIALESGDKVYEFDRNQTHYITILEEKS